MDLLERVFDKKRARELRDQGIAIASQNKATDLAIARDIARMLADRFGKVNIDMVQDRLIRRGIDLGNTAGAIFKTKEWEWTGEVIQSSRISNRARIIRVWRLK